MVRWNYVNRKSVLILCQMDKLAEINQDLNMFEIIFISNIEKNAKEIYA